MKKNNPILGVKNKMRKITAFGVLMLLLLTVVAAAVSAEVSNDKVNVEIEWLKINGDEVDASTVASPGKTVVERQADGDTEVEVRLRLRATADAENLRLRVDLEGYESQPLAVSTGRFNLEKDELTTKKLTLSLPDDMEADDYRLNIFVSDGNSRSLFDEDYILRLDVPRHALSVRDVALSNDEVAAGSALYTTVRVENKGEKAEEVKVTASLDLGEDVVEAHDFIDNIGSTDKKSSEELYLRVPRCAKLGEATLTVTLSYDNDRETTTHTEAVTVVDGGLCDREEARAVVTVGASAAAVRSGERATFPVTVSNTGTSAATFTLETSGADWASVEVSPSNLLSVGAGESKTAFVHVAPDKGVSGKQSFTLDVKEGDVSLKQVSLTVDAKGNDTVLTGVVVAIVVIIVILVIIGIVVGVSRSNDDDEDEKNYY
jgi:uncharacterized membrane protein